MMISGSVLKITLKEAIEFNRAEAKKAAETNYAEEPLTE